MTRDGVRELVLDVDVRVGDHGRLMVGGAPWRILRLEPAGAALVENWRQGRPVDDVPSARRLARRLVDASLMHPRAGPPPVPRSLTVVIPVLDDPDRLGRLVGSLAPELKVVVADDGSTDGSAHRAATVDNGGTYVRRSERGGPGAARNTALALVETELVAFVDADVVASSTTLLGVAGHLGDPRVAAAAPRVASRPGRSRLARYEAEFSPLDLGDRASPVGPGRRVSYVPTACLVARTDTIRELGGFDEDLRHGEDVDLVWRLVATGATVRYDPTFVVEHEPRGSWRSWAAQRRDYGRSAALLAARHGRAGAPVRCSPWSLAVWLAVARGDAAVAAAVFTTTARRLAEAFAHLPDGDRMALEIAARGHGTAGLALARAVRRSWMPVAVGAASVSRRARFALGLALAASAVADWVSARRSDAPVVTAALRLVDDLCYGAGVWEGVLEQRSLAAVLPELTR